ncbi:MAG: DoxX family protein [Hyphomicrobiales bacterium]|nr:DoxX family protein [Hyphomicrobiales bacterium]
MSRITILPASLTPWLHAALRVVAGLLYLEHGTSKLLGFPHDAHYDGLQLVSFMGLAGVLEMVGGLLIVIGLFTRPVAFILSGMMAVAYFMAHASRGFFPALNGGDAAILFCFVFLYFAAAGPGPLSVDGE